MSPELKASGFEREHQLTLEQWTAQQPHAEGSGSEGPENWNEASDASISGRGSGEDDSDGEECGEAVALTRNSQGEEAVEDRQPETSGRGSHGIADRHTEGMQSSP